MYKAAIIGGTGLEKLPPEYTVKERLLENRFGAARVHQVALPEGELIFLSRHGGSHGIAPHDINYRANIQALSDLGIKRILASNAVGSLRLDLVPHSLVALDDFIDMTRARPLTLFDDLAGGIRHTDFSEPYCPELRSALLMAAADLDLDLLPRATYVCADGPRFESPAEVRMYAQLGGDVVGMTGIPEAVFAREAGICYAAVGIVTNFGAGLTTDPVDHADVVERMAVNVDSVRRLFLQVAVSIDDDRGCRCGESVSTQPDPE